VLNELNWSPDSNANRGIFVFTDHGSEPISNMYGTESEIINKIKSNNVSLFIYGEDKPDELKTFALNSGASFASFGAATTIGNKLSNFLSGVGTEELINFETLTQYIAKNAAEQNRVKNLISSNDLLKNNATEALGEIQDIDVAQESIKFSRLKILQEAGVAYAAHSNVSKNTYIKLFE
jgi:flagellin-like hook-associated protein FlgL